MSVFDDVRTFRELTDRVAALEAEVADLRVRLAAARTRIAEETDFQSRTTSDDRGQW